MNIKEINNTTKTKKQKQQWQWKNTKRTKSVWESKKTTTKNSKTIKLKIGENIYAMLYHPVGLLH